MSIDDRAVFAREFLPRPSTVGAVTPSSDPLADLATAAIPATGAPVVVELGRVWMGPRHPAPPGRPGAAAVPTRTPCP